MTNLYKTGICLILTITLFSCKTETKTIQKDRIPVAAAYNKPGEIKASANFSTIQYIPLESNEGTLIGNLPEIQVTANYILVCSSQGQTLLFDRHTGRFITQVGHKGNDPESYSDHYGLADEEGGNIIFTGSLRDKLVFYDFNGKFTGSSAMPKATDAKLPSSFFPLDKEHFIGYYDNFMGGEENRIVFFNRQGNVEATIPNHHPLENLEITNMNVYKGQMANPTGTVLVSRGEISISTANPDVGSISFMGDKKSGSMRTISISKRIITTRSTR